MCRAIRRPRVSSDVAMTGLFDRRGRRRPRVARRWRSSAGGQRARRTGRSSCVMLAAMRRRSRAPCICALPFPRRSGRAARRTARSSPPSSGRVRRARVRRYGCRALHAVGMLLGAVLVLLVGRRARRGRLAGPGLAGAGHAHGAVTSPCPRVAVAVAVATRRALVWVALAGRPAASTAGALACVPRRARSPWARWSRGRLSICPPQDSHWIQLWLNRM